MSETPRPAATFIRIGEDGRPWLYGSRCSVCDAVFIGAREHCGRCGQRSTMGAVRLGERGRLHSFTIVSRSYPGIRVPFVSAIVDLEGGGVIKGNLLEVPPDPVGLPFGMPVRVVFRDAGEANPEAAGHVAHFFVPLVGRNDG